MKTKNIIIIAIAFLCCISNVHAQQDSDSGFTNKKEAENKMVNGVKEGKWIEYADAKWDFNSTKRYVYYRLITYSHGKPIGLIRDYYKNGRLQMSGMYSSLSPSVKEGVFKYYYKNGKLQTYDSCYIKDDFNGIVRRYYKNGKLQFECPVQSCIANGIAKDYYKNGRLKCVSPFDGGILNGLQKVYYQDGKIEYEIPFVDSILNGYLNYYSMDGILIGEIYLKEGVSDTVKVHYENGGLKFVAHYIDTFQNITGKKINWNKIKAFNPLKITGTLKEYSENGNQLTETFIADSIINNIGKQYYKNGKLKGEVALKNGKANGLLKSYYESGVVSYQCHFVYGKPDGVEYSFYESGKIKSETLFKKGKEGRTINFDEAGKEIKK